jgi:hypothetical protein
MPSTYRDRPYQPGKSPDIIPGHVGALSMWRSGLREIRRHLRAREAVAQ